MRSIYRARFRKLTTPALLAALTSGLVLGSAHAAERANAIVAEADLAAAFENGLQLEVDGKAIALVSSRIRLVLSDPRNRNQLPAILNEPGFEAPDIDEAGNDQSDFSVETVLTLSVGGDEVTETASCNWVGAEKLQAECSVYDGGGGFLLRVDGRGEDLSDLKWQIVIGEGLSVGYRAGSSTTSEGRRVDYILRITGREPVSVPLKVR